VSAPDDRDREQVETGLIKLLGIRIEEASADRVVLTCPVTPDLHQPFGLVHGGVYATLAETAASVAGASWFGDRGKVVGVSNHTDFLRAVREGGLRAEATPLSRGRTTQLWQVEITDEAGRLTARSSVRLMNLRTGR
jgi:1,4-dihydroxy-2-naphthoyl-CoA hydrolase